MRALRLLKNKKIYIVTYKLGIYNKLNWNTVLASFDPSSLNSIFITADTSSETPQESPNNKGS